MEVRTGNSARRGSGAGVKEGKKSKAEGSSGRDQSKKETEDEI